MKKLKKNHLIVPKFVLERKEMNKLRGGTPGSSAGCCDCSCTATTNNGCIDGGGTDLGKKAASIE